MNLEAQNPLERSMARGLESVRKNWRWILALGVVLVVSGVVAIVAAPLLVGLAAVILVGVVLLIGGVSQIVHSFFCRKWSGFFVHLLTGILYLVVGLMFVHRPGRAMEVLTLLVAAFLIVGGLFRVLSPLLARFERWGWTFLSGCIALLLGILIWGQWPWSGLWVIGTFVGVDMIFAGWSLIAISSAARKLSPTQMSS